MATVPSTPLERPLQRDGVFTGGLVLAFLIVGGFGMLHHELWSDEILAWIFARDSASLDELYRNLRYEAHPLLWYLGLYGITPFTHNPAYMQVFHLGIATLAVAFFTHWAPFTRLQKILFAFSYFPLYEYGMLSRNYGLGMLFLFLFCMLFETRKRSYLPLALVLVLLANTSIYGLMLSFALELTLVFEIFMERDISTLALSRLTNVLSSGFIAGLGMVGSALQMIRPFDPKAAAGWNTNNVLEVTPGLDPFFALKVFAALWQSYVPIPNFSTYQFWNTNFLYNNLALLKPLVLLLSLGLFLAAIMLFRRRPVVLFLYLLGTFEMLVFMYLKYYGSIRHFGHLFILFMVCLWLGSFYTPKEQTEGTFRKLIEQYKTRFITLILSTQFIAGAIAYTIDLANPFSGGQAAANFIQSRHLEHTFIVASDLIGPPLSGYLDRKIYYPDSERLGTFVLVNRRYISNETIATRGYQLARERKTPVLLILNKAMGKLPTKVSVGFQTSELARFDRSIIDDEQYFIYWLQPTPISRNSSMRHESN
ncbi:hypothetical protein [Anthocerotibacter panamensis]|uniref:hypothetical protein n=1 Tax=Anthocerotibacter panamensis TaxID=2857077 RepID=UPI001C4032F7|nr:hypothetical protein [Anthocerotibacter panamensis]